MHNTGLDQLIYYSAGIIPLIIAITLHEAGHAFAAYKLGDPTAKLMGRMSLDPIKHIDPVGTILLPGLLILANSPIRFGWAKPVPVNYRNLRHPRRDPILVALAGPGMNVILAFISALLLHFVTPEQMPWTFRNIENSVIVNVLLAVFNMLPILPLDGGRVLNALLPPRIAYEHAQTERYGMVILMVLLMLPGVGRMISDYFILLPASMLSQLILMLAGF